MKQILHCNALQVNIALFAKQYSFCAYGRCDEIGLHPGQIPLLKLLANSNGKSHKELAEALSVRPSTITIMIRRMKKNGLLTHTADADDLRIRNVFITEKGRTALHAAEKIFTSLNKQLFDGFSVEEMRTLQKLFQRLQQNLQTLTKN